MVDPEAVLRAYFHQFTVGCESLNCTHPFCRSCPSFQLTISTPSDAVDSMLQIAREYSATKLCPNLPRHFFDPNIVVHAANFQTAVALLDPEQDAETVNDDLRDWISTPFTNRQLFGYLAMDNYDAPLTAKDLHLPLDSLQMISRVTITQPQLFDPLCGPFVSMVASIPERNPSLRDIRCLVISFCFSELFLQSDISSVLLAILTRLVNFTDAAKRIFYSALSSVPQLFDCALAAVHDSLTFSMIPHFGRRTLDEVQNQLHDLSSRLFAIFVTKLRWFGMSADSCRRSIDFVNEPFSELIVGEREVRGLVQRAFSFIAAPALLALPRKAEIFGLWSQVRPQLQGGYGFVDPNFTLEVSRLDLVNETFLALQRASVAKLRMRLVVSFRGEHAVDAGGVSREFIYLFCNAIVREYGMFKRVGSGAFWFDSQTFEMPSQFNYVGQVVALALYNQVLLPMRFPLVLYKKIIGIPLRLEDLEEFDESVGHGIRDLLAMRDRGEDVATCDLRFTAGIEGFRGQEEVPIREGGEAVSVTNENLDEYVKTFVDFILVRSIDRQFKPFSEGFKKVVGDDPCFTMFQYDELDVMISGALVLDWSQLKSTAVYRDGYNERSRAIEWFWEVFEEMSEDEKKQLLRFTTGTDRSPTGGLAEVKLQIQRTGDPTKLPVGHTCFHILGLPDYPNKELLKKNLLIAINWCEGFGLK